MLQYSTAIASTKLQAIIKIIIVLIIARNDRLVPNGSRVLLRDMRSSRFMFSDPGPNNHIRNGQRSILISRGHKRDPALTDHRLLAS